MLLLVLLVFTMAALLAVLTLMDFIRKAVAVIVLKAKQTHTAMQALMQNQLIHNDPRCARLMYYFFLDAPTFQVHVGGYG